MTFRLVRAAVIACLLLLPVAAVAFAHAHLEESDPADGDTITTPYTVTARFSEEFDPERSFIRVHDSTGAQVAVGAVSPDDPTVMTVDLPELQPGEYEVRWQTVTPDDNGVENDTFTFTVAPAPTDSPSPSPTRSATPTSTQGASATAPAPPSATASPTATPSPAATPEPVDGAPSATGTDLVLALVLAAVAIGAVLLFIFARRRG